MEKPTLLLLSEAARKKVLKGTNLIYNAVRLTIGPEGGNALLYGTFGRSPRLTNDGRTIAGVIEPEDPFERMAAKSFKEAAENTNSKAGDGTTTTIVIGGKLLNDVFAKLDESASEIRTQAAGSSRGVMKIKREMQSALLPILEKIKERAKKVESLEELERIAIVSVEDEKLGKIVAKMAWEVGLDGFIDVVEGFKGEIETEVIRGMRLPAKVAAKAFVNNPQRYEMTAQDVPCVVTNYALDNAAQVNAFTQNLKTAKLAIFAPSFSENVLVGLVGAFKNGFHVYPVACPSLRTEQFEDLATYLGAKFVNKDTKNNLEGIQQDDLGFAEKIIVKDTNDREEATIVGGDGDLEGEKDVAGKQMKVSSAVQDRIKLLRAQMTETKVELHKKVLERRIASMASAVGIIRVGGLSQSEVTYQKLKLEDAVYASRAALQEGYVKGGGLCLKEIAEELPETILTSALKAPYDQIQANADGQLEIGDEIVDPAKVVRLALEHSVSVVSNLATVKIIAPEKEDVVAGDGYMAIAKAIFFYVKMWGKKEGLIRENADEMEKDFGDRMAEHMIEGNL